MKAKEICLVCSRLALDRDPECGMETILNGEEYCGYEEVCDMYRYWYLIGIYDDIDVARALFIMDLIMPYEFKRILTALERQIPPVE